MGDHFHAVALANAAIDDVRRRLQNDTLGHRGRKGDRLYGIRRLLRAAETLDDHAADPAPRRPRRQGPPWRGRRGAVAAKELLREVYAAIDLAHARRRLTAF